MVVLPPSCASFQNPRRDGERRIGQIRMHVQHFNRTGNIEATFILNGIFTVPPIELHRHRYYSGKMELTPAVSVLSALAQLTRLRCYLMLTQDGDKTAGDLASALGVPANTMSSHLTILGTAGLVTSTRNGRNIIYRAEAEKIAELMEFLKEFALESRADLTIIKQRGDGETLRS